MPHVSMGPSFWRGEKAPTILSSSQRGNPGPPVGDSLDLSREKEEKLAHQSCSSKKEVDVTTVETGGGKKNGG